jgi:hypothetical protein
MATTTREYLVYRHGSNAANQHLCNKMPVAIVTAVSREKACRTETLENPGVYDSAWLAADSSVSCWANQYFSATPRQRSRLEFGALMATKMQTAR